MRKMKLLSIKDKGLGRYSPPMVMEDILEGQRIFYSHTQKLDRKLFEGNFQLVQLGTFDPETGVIELGDSIVLEENDNLFYSHLESASNGGVFK